MQYEIEEIKSNNIVESSVTTSTGEERILGSFNLHIGGLTIFADRIDVDKRNRLVFVYIYLNDSMVVMYIYDSQTKELI